MFNMNFNDAAPQESNFGVIPKGTKLKVITKVQGAPAGKGMQGDTTGCFVRNAETGSIYVNLELTVVGGRYNNRKIFHMVGFKSSEAKLQGNGGEDKWAAQGRTFIRSALESARGINPKDTTQNAAMARAINSILDLNGMEFVGYVTVDENNKDAQGNPSPRNGIIPITADQPDYQALMQGATIEPGGQKPTASAAAPTWGGPQQAPHASQGGQWGAPPAQQAPVNGAGQQKPAWAQ